VRQLSIADITYELAEAHMAGIGSAPSRPMVAKDIRNLQRRARHARRTSGRWLTCRDLPMR